MNKIIYENVNVEIMNLSEEDIIRTSGNGPFFGEDDDLKSVNKG